MCVPHMHGQWCPYWSEEDIGSVTTGVIDGVNCHLGAENQAQVLNKCS